MLANRFSILLAERQLSIKEVVEDTGISRSAISNIANNPRATVSNDTIDTLCQYLGVTPNDFYLYSPYKIKVYTDYSTGFPEINFYILHNKKEATYSFAVLTEIAGGIDKTDSNLQKYDLYISLSGDKENLAALENIYRGLAATFQTEINTSIMMEIEGILNDERTNLAEHLSNGMDFKKATEYYSELNEGDILNLSISLPWEDKSKKARIHKGTLNF